MGCVFGVVFLGVGLFSVGGLGLGSVLFVVCGLIDCPPSFPGGEWYFGCPAGAGWLLWSVSCLLLFGVGRSFAFGLDCLIDCLFGVRLLAPY